MDDCLQSLIKLYNLDNTDLDNSQSYRNKVSRGVSNDTEASFVVGVLGKKDEIRNGGDSLHSSKDIYKPPHRKQARMGRHFTKKDNGDSRNSDINIHSNSHGFDTIDEEKLAQRRARFAKESKQQVNTNKYNYGFISRGEDTRLKDSAQAREEFFQYILQQFTQYTLANSTLELREFFQKLRSDDLECTTNSEVLTKDKKEKNNETNISENGENNEVTLDSITMSIRKLRESLISIPPSPFHKRVFLFSVRFSQYFNHHQTYIPSVNYLLQYRTPLKLDKSEVMEAAVILVLHMCHANNDPASATSLYFKYIPKRKDVLRILRCWILNDFYTWMHIYNYEVECIAIKSMMRIGLGRMLNLMVKTASQSYFTLSKKVIQECFLPHELSYEEFHRQYSPYWQDEKNDGMITVRQRARR